MESERKRVMARAGKKLQRNLSDAYNDYHNRLMYIVSNNKKLVLYVFVNFVVVAVSSFAAVYRYGIHTRSEEKNTEAFQSFSSVCICRR